MATARPTARTRSCRRPALIAPLGVSVIDNKIVVAQPPDLIVYTDVDRNLKFDPAVDKREVLLTGFHGINHDHSLHSVTVGPDGKWIFNAGNMGGMFTDKSGKTFRIFGSYRAEAGRARSSIPHNPAEFAGKPSDDGHVYVGGFTVRMNPDGTNAEIIGHNYRNSYEQSVTSLGDVFQNDNDDPPAARVAWVMEYANFGFSSNDGQRTWQADRRPGQTDSGGGVAPGRSGHDAGRRRLRRRIADRQRLLRERRARRVVGRDVLRGRAGAQRDLLLSADAQGAGFALDRKIFMTSNVKQQYAGSDFIGGNPHGQGRARDAVPAVRHRGRSRRRALRQRLDRRRASAAIRIWTRPCPARSTGSRRRASCRRCRRSTRRRSTV